MFVRDILCEVLVATIEYQTSSFQPFVPPHVGTGNVADCVAPKVVPAVGFAQVRLILIGKEIAPVHSSFSGGGGNVPTQILKSTSKFVVVPEE